MGGKAFAGVTQSIQSADISPTLTWLSQSWKESPIKGDFYGHLLGSGGKNATSGDLDLNMPIGQCDQLAISEQLTSLLGAEFVKARPGNNQIFTAVPIKGDAEQYGRVQVDLMFGDFEWQKFSYFSAPKVNSLRWGQGTGSYFKGLYRTEYLKALTAYCSDWVLEENNEVIARVGPTFFHDRGLVWRYRHRPMRVDGTSRVQDFKELSKEDFKKIYPTSLDALTDTINDPLTAAKFLLGDYVSVSVCNTLESVFLYTRRYHDSNAIKTINKIFVERLNNLKVEVPLDDFAEIYLKV